jgi:hypothetical protein
MITTGLKAGYRTTEFWVAVLTDSRTRDRVG